jgi:hypothetical protein
LNACHWSKQFWFYTNTWQARSFGFEALIERVDGKVKSSTFSVRLLLGENSWYCIKVKSLFGCLNPVTLKLSNLLILEIIWLCFLYLSLLMSEVSSRLYSLTCDANKSRFRILSFLIFKSNSSSVTDSDMCKSMLSHYYGLQTTNSRQLVSMDSRSNQKSVWPCRFSTT